MLKTTLTFLFTVFLATAAYSATSKQVVDCNKASALSATGVYMMYEGYPTAKLFEALPEAAKKAGMNEAELIVATGIIANVSVFGAKQIYSDLELTKEPKERKLQATRNIFYMFCKEAFEIKNYY